MMHSSDSVDNVKSPPSVNVTKRRLPLTRKDSIHSKKLKVDPQTQSKILNGEENGFDALKSTIQEAIEGFKDCKIKFKETADKLSYLSGIVKNCVPTVLDSLPPDVSQVIQFFSENTHNEIFPMDKEKDCPLMKPDVSLVEAMNDIKKDFNSCVFVLETIPECLVIKERLLMEIQSKEEKFEEMLIKFKQNKSWLLNEGFQLLENDHQAYLKTKYKTFMETLDINMASMKAKRNTLEEALRRPETQTHISEENSTGNSREPRLEQRNDPSNSLFVVSTTPTTQSIGLSGSSNYDSVEGVDKKSVCQVNINLDDTKNTNNSTFAYKKDWPGKSLPDLSDLVSDESLNSSRAPSDSATSTIDSQDDSDDIVEALMAEVPELTLDINPVQDVGNHFLAQQFASVTSPSDPGFQYNVPLKPSQKLNKNVSTTYESFCPSCQKNFESVEALYSHKLRNHVSQVCNLCTEIVENVTKLTEHVSKRHLSYSLCPECFKAVETIKMSNHALKHIQSVDDKLKCRACLKIFLTLEEVETHEREHKNAFYPCKHCGKLFLTKYDLLKHSSDKHLVDKTNVCKVCYLDFVDRSSLSRHLRMSHQMVKNKSPKMFVCICCDQDCQNSSELIQHMRINHQNDKLVDKATKGEDTGPPRNKCPHCTQYFKNPKVRAVHEIIFHETAPFLCVCNSAFFTKAKLDEHFLKHTRLDEEKRKPKRCPRMSVIPN